MSMPVTMEEVRSLVERMMICTDCELKVECDADYPDSGCPAFRFLARIARDGIRQSAPTARDKK